MRVAWAAVLIASVVVPTAQAGQLLDALPSGPVRLTAVDAGFGTWLLTTQPIPEGYAAAGSEAPGAPPSPTCPGVPLPPGDADGARMVLMPSPLEFGERVQPIGPSYGLVDFTLDPAVVPLLHVNIEAPSTSVHLAIRATVELSPHVLGLDADEFAFAAATTPPMRWAGDASEGATHTDLGEGRSLYTFDVAVPLPGPVALESFAVRLTLAEDAPCPDGHAAVSLPVHSSVLHPTWLEVGVLRPTRVHQAEVAIQDGTLHVHSIAMSAFGLAALGYRDASEAAPQYDGSQFWLQGDDGVPIAGWDTREVYVHSSHSRFHEHSPVVSHVDWTLDLSDVDAKGPLKAVISVPAVGGFAQAVLDVDLGRGVGERCAGDGHEVRCEALAGVAAKESPGLPPLAAAFVALLAAVVGRPARRD